MFQLAKKRLKRFWRPAERANIEASMFGVISLANRMLLVMNRKALYRASAKG